MKFAVSLCCLALLVVVAAADAGQFVPKAFYTMDAEGHKSDVHPISPHAAKFLNRQRRQLVIESTATSASNGEPVKFTKTDAKIEKDHTRTDGTLGQGHVVTTTGVIDKSGKVTYKTEEGYFQG